MKKTQEPDLQEELQDPTEPDSAASVDDFLRQLEAKEKDLHITADLSIEIEESDYDFDSVPDNIAADLEQSKTAVAVETSKSDQRFKSEIAALKNQVAELKAERLKIVDRNKLRTREFDNFKNRMERERRETFVSQVSNLATAMLPVLDNLERALQSATELKEERSQQFQQFFDGIFIVNQQIIEVLARMGVHPIATVGESFDPNFHEAVAVEEPGEGREKNTICEELIRGYRIGEKVIRHSMVKVVGGRSMPETAVAVQNSEVADVDEYDDEIDGSIVDGEVANEEK